MIPSLFQIPLFHVQLRTSSNAELHLMAWIRLSERSPEPTGFLSLHLGASTKRESKCDLRGCVMDGFCVCSVGNLSPLRAFDADGKQQGQQGVQRYLLGYSCTGTWTTALRHFMGCWDLCQGPLQFTLIVIVLKGPLLNPGVNNVQGNQHGQELGAAGCWILLRIPW